MSIWFVAIAALMILLAAWFLFQPYGGPSEGRNSGHVSLIVCAFAIGAAAALYFVIARPDVVPSSASTPERAGSGDAQMVTADGRKQIGSVGSLVEGLAERLENEPDDAEGWILLAKSYNHLGKPEESAAAYARAKALGASDASLEQLSEQATSPAASTISGRVSVAGEPPPDGSTVFVIARRADGSSMPLAVLRKPVSELPFDFVLGDEHSMVKGAGLSSAGTVIISAKVSASGDALRSANGYEVQSEPIEVASAPHLNLVIDPVRTGSDE